MRRTITAAPAPRPPANPVESFEDMAAGVGALVTTTTRGLVVVSIVLVCDAVVDGGGVGPGPFRSGGVGPGPFRSGGVDIVELTVPIPAW